MAISFRLWHKLRETEAATPLASGRAVRLSGLTCDVAHATRQLLWRVGALHGKCARAIFPWPRTVHDQRCYSDLIMETWWTLIWTPC
jgi:hypothetical protein